MYAMCDVTDVDDELRFQTSEQPPDDTNVAHQDGRREVGCRPDGCRQDGCRQDRCRQDGRRLSGM